MADLHRGMRVYDLRLTGQQVAGIVAGSVVTVGVAFALGMGAGHRLAEGTVAAKAADADSGGTSEPAGKPLPKMDFTYQRELTKSDPPAPAPKPQPPPQQKPANPAPAAASAAIASAPSATAPDAGPSAGSASAQSPAPHASDAAPAPPSAVVAAVAPPPPSPGATASEATAPAQPRSAAGTASAAVAADGPETRFTVQFGAPSDRAVAEKMASKLMSYGYSAYVTTADIPDKGRFYRVRVGRFTSKEAAEALREEAANHHKLPGMVMPSR
jgi:cell division septation protein DedD